MGLIISWFEGENTVKQRGNDVIPRPRKQTLGHVVARHYIQRPRGTQHLKKHHNKRHQKPSVHLSHRGGTHDDKQHNNRSRKIMTYMPHGPGPQFDNLHERQFDDPRL